MNYTKGEWKVISGMVETAEGIPIARMDREPGNGTVPVERDTNANLIAAAPENYTANSETLRLYRYLRDHCEALWSQLLDECPGIVEHWDRIKQSLAKAEGK